MTERWEVLQKLADDGKLDELLALVTLDEVADTWHAYNAEPVDPPDSDVDHPLWWAHDVWWLTADLPPERRALRRALLVALIERAPAAEDLGQVGAGPLEEFVADDEDDLTWIEQRCAASDRWRTALANVWCSSDVSEATHWRLERAAGANLG